ncbi:MAG: hypothetical protein FIA99_05135 [Ruminiclostridium sp.]|nr:hypothetical protein [Ruminiclostridium sp.]
MQSLLKIGFLALTMTEFDAILDVEDVRKKEIPDINEPDYLKPMIAFLQRFGEVIYPGVVGEETGALNARNCFARGGADIIIAHEISFTLDLTCLQALDRLDIPVIIWNTQDKKTLNSDLDFAQTMANSGIAGVPQLTNALYKQGRKFKVMTGHEGQEKTYKQFEKVFKALSTAKSLRTSKIGMIGHVYPGMTTLTVEEAGFKEQVGPSVEHIMISDVIKASKEISLAEIETDIVNLRRKAEITGLKDTDLIQSSKIYFGFKKVLQKRNIDAAGILCGRIIQEEALGVAPCYALSRLLDDGIPTTCECDVPTAAAMLIVKSFAGEAWFQEFYTMDMEKDLLMLSHCGYGNCSLANPVYGIKVKPQPCFPGPAGSGAAYEFAAKEGDITIVSLTVSSNGKYKLVAALAEAVGIPPYPIACPQMMIRFKAGNLQDSIEAFCQSGAMHHMAVGYGDITDEIRLLAEFLNIGYEKI